ncbi:hypothetical protein MTR67_042752 [Solanum verrucosum]|uniref:SWIM-type domain-containing protein n=1 Tax=Solanum verrucosum TaxID=315347 RepID=A0AAF0ZRF7_SOLVR|nr:hypothetical protein MTR67_042752 [Solanum verrucosum]
MMDALMYYNIEYWCKVYFNTRVKCDSVDNNMSECFNAWILAARHKTIITMLEEIRMKMMTRIGNLKEFTNTWKCNFSPMALKVLQKNIDMSMNCSIEFNGVVGFEVRERLCQHTVDLGRRTCSCIVWKLKDIPCACVVAVIYFKKCDHVDYIDSCYSKETYLRTYVNVLQPITNMEMWSISTNPTVAPPEIIKREVVHKMVNHQQGRNHQVQVMEEATHQVQVGEEAKHQVQAGEENPSTEGDPPAKRGRGRPRKTPTAPPAPLTYPTLSASPPPTVTSLPTTSKKGRPRKTPPAHPAYLEHPAPPAPPTSFPTTSKRGRGRGSESTIPYKRSSIMGLGVFQAENRFKAFNHGMPSFKILSTGAIKVTKSADITGDIGFKPSTKQA